MSSVWLEAADRRERLAGLAGGVDILDNEAIEAADQAEARALRRRPASPP